MQKLYESLYEKLVIQIGMCVLMHVSGLCIYYTYTLFIPGELWGIDSQVLQITYYAKVYIHSMLQNLYIFYTHLPCV